MPFWFTLLLYAAVTVLGQLFRPKQSKPKPATLADLDFPTAEETRSIPKGYGTFLMKAPNVVSVTDFSTEVIKSKIDPLTMIMSFGLAKKQVIGYKYFCGIEMALSYRLDAITKIIVGDKVAWTGNQTADGEIFINKPTLFGGSDPASGGNGGLVGYLGVHLGDPAATKDSYLISEYGNYSAHRGVCYLVWKGQHRAKGSGYLGNNARVDAWQIEGRFIPNNLGVPTYSNINTGDANPAEVIYDILRNGEYAIGMPADYVDLPSFQAAAQTYYNDGLGFSALWDTSKACKDTINSILQYTDSVLYSDLQTGKLVLKPARADYVIGDLLSFDDSNIIAITSYTRGAWAETTNEVLVPFINRSDDYVEQTAQAQDLANIRLQNSNGGNGVVSTSIQHLGISNPTTAANIAQRDLRALTTPLAKVSLQINLKGYTLTIGQPFRFSTSKITDQNGNPISGMVLRCIGLKIGNPNNPVMDIEAIEDVFNSTLAVYAVPPSSSGSATSSAPIATSTHLVDEVPYMLADERSHLWAIAAAPAVGSSTYDMLTSLDNVTYEPDDANNTFTPTGLLNGSYSALTAAKDNSGAFIVTGAGSNGLDRLVNATAAEVANGANMMLVVEGSVVEIMAFESFSIVSGNYVLANVWRGLMDTTPKAFTSAARVWFFSYGDGRSTVNFVNGATGYAKLLTRTLQGVLDESGATALSKVMGVRALRPYAPGNIRINTVYNGSIPATGDITVAWSHRDRTRQGNLTLQNAGTVGLESGAFYTLKIYKQTGTLLRTVTDLVTESYVYTNTQEMADNGGVLADALTFVLYATRDGITSHQAQIRGSARTGSTIASPAYAPSGAYTAPAAGNSTSISGITITGSPTGTNNTPVYDPVTGVITWSPGGGSVTVQEIDGVPSGVANTIQFPNGTLTDLGGGVFKVTPLAGAPGTNGTNGTNGLDGSTWYTGSAVPGGGLGVNGDFYLRSTNGDVYEKAAGSWSVVANIKGATGMPGSESLVSVTTASLAVSAVETGTIATGAACYIKAVTSTNRARIRLYKTAAHRTADLARAFGSRTYVGTEHGMILDIQRTAGGEPFTWKMSPDALATNGDVPVDTVLYYTIQNLSAAPAAITVDFRIIA
jgi:hypothetical protein